MINSVVWRIVIMCCLLMLLPACTKVPVKSLSADRLREIREGMSESDVVSVLGKPDRIKSMLISKGSKDRMKMLEYTLKDGRRWVIVINERDETIGSGASTISTPLASLQRAF